MIYLLQSSICLAVFYLVYMVFFKTCTYHNFSRYYLLSTLFLSILIPWIEITTSVQALAFSSTASNSIQSAETAEKSIFTLQNIILSTYLIGVAVSLFLFLFKLVKLLHIIAKGEKQMIDGYNIVYVNKEIGTCSFLKYIIFSKENQSELIHFELAHEKSHINQFHSIDIILAWIYQSFFWFNPIAYLYKIRLLEVHEFLADQGAIKQIDKSSYQEYILGVISQSLQPQLVNNFKSIIKTRLIMMNSKSKPSIWSYFTAVVVLITAVFLFSCKAKKTVRYTMTPNGPIPVLSEMVTDTLTTIDYDTYEESITYHKRELYYVADTFYNAKGEMTIVKTYLEPQDFIKKD